MPNLQIQMINIAGSVQHDNYSLIRNPKTPHHPHTTKVYLAKVSTQIPTASIFDKNNLLFTLINQHLFIAKRISTNYIHHYSNENTFNLSSTTTKLQSSQKKKKTTKLYYQYFWVSYVSSTKNKSRLTNKIDKQQLCKLCSKNKGFILETESTFSV